MERQLRSDDTAFKDMCPRPFKNVMLCATGITDKAAIFKKALELGAGTTDPFTDRVTHLIAVAHGGPKYNCALDRGIPIVQPSWITENYDDWLHGDDVETDLEGSIEGHRLPVFSDIVVCVSGIPELERRADIRRIVEQQGGEYVKAIERPVRVTHLLCSGDEESDKMRYAEKFTARGEGQIHMVWEEWLWDSLKAKGRLEEARYNARNPRPPPFVLPNTQPNIPDSTAPSRANSVNAPILFLLSSLPLPYPKKSSPMEQCLQIPEILRYVCDELDGKSCLSAALTNHTFLEPGLDSLWHHIDSMHPLICCLPAETGNFETDPDINLGMYLFPNSDFKRDHLNRYLSVYAHRIRSFTSPIFDPRKPDLSTDFLVALQIVTDHKHGALAPLLRKVVWSPPSWTGVKLRATISAFISLFVGEHIESLRFRATELNQEALHNASMLTNIKRISRRLTGLTVEGEYSAEFIQPFLIPFSWDSLEVLKVSTYSPALIRCLATLPRLHTLEVHDKELAYSTLHVLPEPQTPPPPTDFARLRSLSLGTENATDRVWCILEHLPLTNQLQKFEVRSTSIGKPSVCQGIINAIALHCNPWTLTSIRLQDWDVLPDERDPTPLGLNQLNEADQGTPVDISPLYPFDQLEVLVVSWFPDVRLSAQDATTIPRCWPRLCHLDLCPPYGLDGRMPPFSHTHLLNIVTGCPALTYLGLRFDATQLMGGEQFPFAPPHQRLSALRVGNSPISSPSRVLAFLKSHFPGLDELDSRTLTVFDRRWEVVEKGLLAH